MSNILMNIQSKLVAPKGQWNKFGGYAYRSAEDILNAVKPLLAENGATLTLTDEPVLVGDWHYIKATATFKSNDEEQVVTAFARESENKKGQDVSQITGTASSYARKYALNGLFLIDDNKDADTNSYHQQTASKAPSRKSESKPNTKPMSQQEQTTAQNKGKLFAGFVKQIAEMMDTDEKSVKDGLIKEAKQDPRYANGNQNEQASLLVRVAEKMRDSAKEQSKK